MGLRRTALVAIKDALNGITIEGDVVLTATNLPFNPYEEEKLLPKVAVLSDPENIEVGLFGSTKDRSMSVGIYGQTMLLGRGEDLFLDAEDVLEAIVSTLTTEANATVFREANFSIISMGPILVEKDPARDDFATLSVPLSIVFLDP